MDEFILSQSNISDIIGESEQLGNEYEELKQE